MKSILSIFLLFCHHFVDYGTAEHEKYERSVHGYEDSPSKTFIFNSDPITGNIAERHKRSLVNSINETLIIPKMNYLNDSHNQLMVHWVGENSNVIICLARASSSISLMLPVGPSAVYISYDYGDTYVNKTEQFKLPNRSYATLEKFYNHPKYNTHFVFADVRHNFLYVTDNHGRDIKRIELNFTPSDVLFDELRPSVFLVLDKVDPVHKLWVTEDFGQNFRQAQNFVKAMYWVKQSDFRHNLVVQRMEPSGYSAILYSHNLFANRSVMVQDSDIKDFYVKAEYLFSTKLSSKGTLQLYVSYKLGKKIKCVFHSQLEHRNYFIVDVTNNRALVAVSHSDTVSHLYVSGNLDTNESSVKFTLSLEDVFCYFPNSTWYDSWIHRVSDDAFADVYKVEGLQGIYIASQVLLQPSGSNIGPQHLGSVITFDHGRSWRLIPAPEKDVEGQPTSCSVHNNCSLHLSQKFSQLYPDTRSIGILSSKSAPGIIIATGVLGRTLKGHYGVYISHDAGLTWKQTLRDLYFFNMGDHGGVLTAVKYLKLRDETRHILFSTDEGETWRQTAFHNQNIRLYGLMTEPGENTTIFTMFGSLLQEHRWIIIKLDLRKAFAYNCSKDDYKTWSPSQSDENRSYIPCVMGQQLTYQRRMPHANCYNGIDFDAPIEMKPCECDVHDYECDFGFSRANKSGHCVCNTSILGDPYKIPLTCKPGMFYKRTKGYRKIQGDVCVAGFQNHYLPEEIPCPFKEAQDFLLFAQRERISRFNLITKTLEELPVKKLKNVVAIDFDMKNNCIYWADIALDNIGRQCFNDSGPEILVASDLASIEGMALDWISNTLYFVDGLRSKIELIRTDINHSGRMRRTILNSDKLKKPRGIAVHPSAGYMFWTDWSNENPSVNRADLDGTNIIKLFGKPKVEWPNGITIDYIAERIYWVDARLDYIASSDLHGDYVKIIVSHEDVVSHPFGIAVFKNTVYWDDWKRNAIFSADKDSFRGVEILQKQLLGLMDLKVYAHGLQVGNNICSNNQTCPYICVGLPKGNHRCLCPDGMIQNQGKCLCPGNVPPLANYTCPSYQNTCGSDHFKCDNGFCVPKGWSCDGEDDCGDNSDEKKCSAQSCLPHYFSCGDGKCLPHYWKCDFDKDCADGSDEENCARQNCTKAQFRCKNERCIPEKWRCDGENDCRDSSDEMDCYPSERITCKTDEFQCKSGGVTCIPMTWHCDGEKDCKDGSDEGPDCKNTTCQEGQFSCGPSRNKCIYLSWVCDGDNDCPDGSDERNCTTPIIDTSDISEQFMPKNGTCPAWMFKCLNNRCIPHWWKCDDADDCGDGSDEIGCPRRDTTTTRTTTTQSLSFTCGTNQFRCASGACIAMAWVCDAFFDCDQGEDEDKSQCANFAHCSDDQFQCKIDGSCVSMSAICNGIFDCPDSTDEAACDHKGPNGPATPSCSIGYFPCDGNSCEPLAKLCDGKHDCIDGYDESNCTNSIRVYQVLQMGVDERRGNESSLLLYWWLATPLNDKLEFMPSISKVGENDWKNQSWTENTEYIFTKLKPWSKYNMTVYVRSKNNTKNIFPPAKYYVSSTGEAVPSEPFNLTAVQKNGSHILLTWNKPTHPNGQIFNYQISWFPPLPSIKLKLSGNETSHLLPALFESNKTYTFYVTALNKKYESKRSQYATLVFDGDANLSGVKDLKIDSKTENSITLSWKYNQTVEGFQIEITSDKYPRIEPKTTKMTNITINNLSPGAQYILKVYAFKKHIVGPSSFLKGGTDGIPLPEIPYIEGNLFRDIGTGVELRWDKPRDNTRKANWSYGVYYGIEEETLYEKPRLNTTSLYASITNLEACEIYTFKVGIVGPYGIGPLSATHADLATFIDEKAPPKNLKVNQVGDNPLKIKVQWVPSCLLDSEKLVYIIHVYEITQKHVWNIRKTDTENLSHVFNIAYGASYQISVKTDFPDSMYTPNVTYHAPPILPPYEVKAFVENNGSYVVYWQERDVPPEVGPFTYEVLLSEGETFNESTAQRFPVSRPPFIYTNTSSKIYTFSVQIVAKNGYRSLLSERLSAASETPTVAVTGSNLPLILGLSAVTLIVLAVLGLFIIKHRRLQNSFTRFANSHYDTRSGAATFDDNGLEEEDSPQITGFSDDEPLVIA